LNKGVLLLPIILVVLLTSINNTATALETPSATVRDCTYLLAVLEKAINYTETMQPELEDIANTMLAIHVDPGYSNLHVKVYRAILDYYTIIQEPRVELISKLYSIYQDLDSVNEYAKKLQSCSRDPEASYAIAARVSLRVIYLKSRVEDLIKQLSMSQEAISINITDKIYEPGEEVLIQAIVKNSTCTPTTAILGIYGVPLYQNNFECSGSMCYTLISVPYAYLVKDYLKTAGYVKFTVTIKALCSGVEARLYRFITTSYSYPRLVIDCPSITQRGDLLNIMIYSYSGRLEGVLTVKNSSSETILGEITIGESPVNYTVYVDESTFSIGKNTLKLCVNASEKTLPYCFERPVIVQPRYPPVEIKALQVYLTWDGSIQVLVTNLGNRSFTSKIMLSTSIRSIEAPVSIGNLYILQASILPISIVNLYVTIQDPLMIYDTYQYSETMIVINASSILILVAVGSVLTAILREHEKLFILMLRSGGFSLRIRPLELAHRAFNELLTPYVLGLGSRIATIYYDLVRKITRRLPQPSETLREHYESVVAPLIKSRRSRELLQRLLQLVERDLYSRSKPEFREAIELYEGVLSSVEEEA
jgi:hypothetical protein